jgi:hypothetical protein
MKTTNTKLMLVCLLLTAGCKLPNDGAIDVAAPPYVSSITLTPTIWDVPLPTGTDSASTLERIVTVKAQVRVDNLGLPITHVRCIATAPDGTLLLSDQELRDDGVAPDLIANDGWYTRQCTLLAQRSNLGAYTFRVTAIDDAGTKSNDAAASLLMRLQLTTQNYAPTLEEVVVPDTITVPPAGQINIARVTVAVQDSNGLYDIATVKVSVIRVEDGAVAGTYNMHDDGGISVDSYLKLTSGDATAGDGVYSIQFPVSSTPKDVYRDFKFVAIDRSGLESTPITKRAYFR